MRMKPRRSFRTPRIHPPARMTAGAVVLALTGFATAAPINYGNLSGSSVDFLGVTEDSGTDPTPLYASPTVTGDTLGFDPTASFSSSAPMGPASGDTTDGKLSLVIEAKPGFYIDTVALSEFGDYSLVATDGTSAMAIASGVIFGVDDVSNTQTSDVFAASGTPFSVTGPDFASGTWNADALLDYTGLNVTRVEIILDNTLQTVAQAGAAAFIAKNGFDLSVQTSVIPEPGTLLLATGGMVLIIGTRWRERHRA